MTYTLHGTWLPTEQRFFFWGESLTPRAHAGRRRRQTAHPFALSLEELHTRTADLRSSRRVPAEHLTTIWLPSVGGRPLPLRELQQAGAVVPAGPPELAPWRVHGLLLAPLQALELLIDLGEGSGAAQETVGSDLQAWRLGALLVYEIVARQQVLPGLARTDQRLVAAWVPRPDQPLTTRLSALAAALPPLCRAVVERPELAPAPRELVGAFVASCADALARSLLAGSAGVRPAIAGPPPGPALSWLRALASLDPTIPLQGRAAEELFRAWRSWTDQGQVAGDESFQITFRLEPPPEQEQPWRLSYLLQAVDDPSLLVPAAQIWRERGQTLRYLDRRFDNPQERLLRGLAFAAHFCEPIGRSLRQPAPDHALLSMQEAFAFLSEVGPLMEQSGFGLLVPSWWTSAGRLQARARASQRKQKKVDSNGRLSLSEMVSFRWQLSIGDTPLDPDEFERLVALKQPLVMVRGEWVVLDPSEAQAALKLLHKGGELSMAEALRIGLEGAGAAMPGLPPGIAFGGLEAEGELGELLQALAESQRLAPIPQPAGFRGQLRPYQLRGLAWLAFMRRVGLGPCLADDMGLGKTAQTIALMLHAIDQQPAGGPALLVCPTSVVGNWRRELARFAPELRVLVHQGADRLRDGGFIAAAGDHDVVITSYPLLHRDRALLTAPTWRMAVLDEAQNIKNSDTRQAQAARALQADMRLALTGTPVENRLTELWSIMAFLNPGYLGSETEFRRVFARPIERAGDAEAAGRLRRISGPFILRRLKTDRSIIEDLPDKIESNEYVPLTAEQATLYEAEVRQALDAIEGAEDEGDQRRRRGLVLAMLTRLKQICNHPAHFLKDGTALPGRSGKLDRLIEQLEELIDSDERALIFTQFAEMGELLERYLPDRLLSEVLFLHGGTPVKQREEMVRRFQAAAGPRIFILSLKAGGVGLNLTSASQVFHFDRWWNPAVEDQATDRAFRIGQVRNVLVHKYVCIGTLEERIDEMIRDKRALAAQVLEAGEGWLTELSTDRLRELVALRHDEVAVGERG